MNLLRHIAIPLAILSIAGAQGKDCNLFAFLRIDHGDGGIEEVWPQHGNTSVYAIGPGETAEYVFEANYANECSGVRATIALNGSLIYDQTITMAGVVPLTQEGFYVPSFPGGVMPWMIGVMSGDAPFFLSFSGPPPTLLLSAKVWLDGPYNSSTQLMNDGLRMNNLIPTTMGSITLGPSVLTVSGPNAIVDWVTVTVKRDGYSVKGWYALLQRDGDVVSTDGASPLSFVLPLGNYNVMVRHRNHLGCVTAPIAFTANTTVDLRSASVATMGTDARKVVGSARTLWPGSTYGGYEHTKRISYTGNNNDRDPILTLIGGTVPTNTVAGYYLEDVNLDGVVKYTGANNDRDPILTTIGGTVPTIVRMEQLQ